MRTIEKLSAAKVRSAKAPGLYGDGGGLYLHVHVNLDASGRERLGKSWVFRFMLNGRAREMGLGPLHTIGLGDARELAREARKRLLAGIDPLEERNAARNAARLEAAKAITFEACAQKYIAAHKAAWKNGKHQDQWTSTLRTYAYPVLGSLSVGEIDTGHVTKVLEPIWTKKPETASRVRGRIEAVLDYARTHRWREDENPARWRGHLENVLPKKTKVAKVEHHAALPYGEIAAFMTALRQQNGTAARALEFTVLTAARTNETIGATWGEINLKSRVWTIPAERMKAGVEHRIPLSEDAVAVLKQMAKHQGSEGFVFKSGKAGLSNMAMLKLVQDADRMNRPGVTVHGMRAVFKTWASETGKASDITEAALAHSQGKLNEAYNRGDLLERRRRLMAAWADYCNGRAKVVALPAHEGAA